MAMNPGRPKSLDDDSVQEVTKSVSGRRHPWQDIRDLAGRMAAEAKEGKRVVLTPQTAAFVAAHLATAAAKPTRDEVALMICTRGEANRCGEPCYGCMGKANMVVNAYGQSLDRKPL